MNTCFTQEVLPLPNYLLKQVEGKMIHFRVHAEAQERAGGHNRLSSARAPWSLPDTACVSVGVLYVCKVFTLSSVLCTPLCVHLSGGTSNCHHEPK